MTNATAVNAILLDDNDHDRGTFRRLERYGLPCTAIEPPSLSAVQDEVVAAVNDGVYDLVLVDFLLDQEATKQGQNVNYRGSAPAALLKDRCPHIPVVLVTTEDKYQEYIKHRSELDVLFDFVLPKNKVRTKEDRMVVAGKLQDLALGFRRLRSVIEGAAAEARWESLRKALMATSEELYSLRGEWPSDLPGSAAELARWLLKGLLRFPGPLRDDAEAAVILGMTKVATDDEPIREWASAASYTGVFSRIYERWWSGRLFDALEQSLGESALRPSGVRAAALAEKIGLQESHVARCSWCEEPSVHRVCCICGAPVDATHHLEVRHSKLKVRHSKRPEWALPEIVCFRCIETGEDEDAAIRYGAGTADLIEDLRSGRLRGR